MDVAPRRWLLRACPFGVVGKDQKIVETIATIGSPMGAAERDPPDRFADRGKTADALRGVNEIGPAGAVEAPAGFFVFFVDSMFVGPGRGMSVAPSRGVPSR